MSNTSEYKIWKGIRKRCFNNKTKFFHNYGGRGISICKRWLASFPNFFKDMGPRPSPQHSIDRINNNKGYSPSNCRWVTRKEQNSNTRRTVKITINGTTKCIVHWCDFYNTSTVTYYRRIKEGMSPKQALETPRRSRWDKC